MQLRTNQKLYLLLQESQTVSQLTQERLRSVNVWEVLLNVLPTYLYFNFQVFCPFLKE